MTQSVLFNGAVLIRAGGATKVDVSAFQNLGLGGIGVVGVIGEAEAGEPDAVHLFRTPAKMIETFKEGVLADAANLAFRPMNDPRIPGGAQVVLAVKVNQSLQASLTLQASATDMMTLTSKDWGIKTNKITVEVTTSGSGKIVELEFKDGANDPVTETSPILGGTAEFTLEYTGTGTAATADITTTALTTTITAGPGGEDLNILFADFPTLADLIDKINLTSVYTAVAVTNNPFAFQNTDLDRVTSVDVKTAAADFKAQLFRIIEWVTDNSFLVSATRETTGTGAPDDTTGKVPLAGGLRGISSNTNWQDGLDLLGTVRVNQLVPLISEDLTNQGFGSTATFVSVAAAADSHGAFQSSTKGKNEVEIYLGMKDTKTNILAQAGILQSPHSVLTGQRITRANAAGDLVEFDEWALALQAAGGRGGAPLGEPLVHKGIRTNALTQDSSWTPLDDGEDMILGGVTFAFSPRGQGGFKFDRVVTTYTKLDNDALVEESIVTNLKNLAFETRTQLENIFTGVRGRPATVANIKAALERILEEFRKQGAIVDSILENGEVLKAYRDVDVVLNGDIAETSVVVSPVSGINFQLNTIFAVPAVIAA